MLLLLGSCGSSVTQIVALIETDMVVPDDVAAFRVRTLRADTDVEEELTSRTVAVSADTTFPIAIAVEPDDLMVIGRVVVEVEAQSDSGTRVVARRAATEFFSGEQLALPMFINAMCRRVTCPMGNSCGDMGRCASQEIMPGSLESYGGELD